MLLLGLNGLLVGILQSYDRFSIAAISPLVWNVVIIVLVVVLRPHFHSDLGIYAYAIAILAATVVQLAMAGGGAAADRLPARLPDRLARSARAPGLRADAAGDDRPRASSTSTS